MENTKVAGVPITVINKKELLNHIENTIREGRQLSLVAVNARKIVRTVQDTEMQLLMSSFDVFLADGTAVIRAAECPLERITGIDLMMDICRESGRLGAKIFLYGASEASNVGAQKMLKNQFPDIQIAGYCNGYEDEGVIDQIRDSKADILFVAKGTPAQEEWIMKNKYSLNVNILMGVGGALDVCSGQVRRAPVWMQKTGLEWMYRMLIEPKRMLQIPELLTFMKIVRQEKKRRISEGEICREKKSQ